MLTSPGSASRSSLFTALIFPSGVPASAVCFFACSDIGFTPFLRSVVDLLPGAIWYPESRPTTMGDRTGCILYRCIHALRHHRSCLLSGTREDTAHTAPGAGSYLFPCLITTFLRS